MLEHSISFSPEQAGGFFSALPECPAVFLVSGGDAYGEPYINKTANLRKRLERLLSAESEDNKRLNLRASTRIVEYTLTGSDFENRLLLYRAMRRQFPGSYRKRMKLIPAPLLKLGWENEYPRAYFTRRLSKFPPVERAGPQGTESKEQLRAVYYGPFQSKAKANKFLNDALDLFKSRRCTFNIHPDPTFPGCMYSEMKMCLAPCFAGCTQPEYVAEVTRVQSYLDSRAGSLVSELEKERDVASAELHFEQASALHARIEKVKAPWTGMAEIVGRLEQLRAVIVQRSAHTNHVALFEFRDGLLCGPVQFDVQGMQHPNPKAGSTSLFAHPHLTEPLPVNAAAAPTPVKAKPQTLEARVAEALANIETRKPERGEVADHLALLKRWYYRSTKKGEVFITHSGELPLRRIVRGISRVAQGETSVPPAEAGG